MNFTDNGVQADICNTEDLPPSRSQLLNTLRMLTAPHPTTGGGCEGAICSECGCDVDTDGKEWTDGDICYSCTDEAYRSLVAKVREFLIADEAEIRDRSART